MMYVFVPGNVHEGTFGRTIIESSSSSPPPLTSLIVYKKEILKFTGYMSCMMYVNVCTYIHVCMYVCMYVYIVPWYITSSPPSYA